MIRGLIANPAGNKMFAVIDQALYLVSPSGVLTQVGTLTTRRGPVGLKIGLTQLVVVDGARGYVYDMETQTFGQITAEGWLGSNTVDYINGRFTFVDPGTQTFFYSEVEDAHSIDALAFETASASPDRLIGQCVSGRMLILFGEVSSEVWQETGDLDAPLQPNVGAYIEVGLKAPFSAKDLDNTVYWLGRDERGDGQVFKLEGLRPVRVSTAPIEEKIQQAIRDGNDISKALAYAYQQDGHAFYVLQVPGLDTTWVYDVMSGGWHERTDFVNGDHVQHRGKYHCYCYGKHLIGGDDDIIYEYDPRVNTNAGDPLVRERISPHMAEPGMQRMTFPRMELDCTVGTGLGGSADAKVMLRYSDDGGATWPHPWRTATLGAVGQYKARAQWLRCGSARDRVWQIRCTDDVPFAIVRAAIEARK